MVVITLDDNGSHLTNRNASGATDFFLPTLQAAGSIFLDFSVSISGFEVSKPIALRSDYTNNSTDFILIGGGATQKLIPESDVTQGYSITVRCVKCDKEGTIWQVTAKEGNWI